MATFAIIEGGVVANIILADEWPNAINITNTKPCPGPGWTFDGRAFAPPAPDAPRSLGTRITKLALRQRFGTQALIDIELAAIHNPTAPPQQQRLAANLRVMLEDVQAASYIDLALRTTRAGVQQLETAGLLPAGKATEVLDTPVQAHEVPSP